ALLVVFAKAHITDTALCPYLAVFIFYWATPRPPSPTLFPYTTLFRSIGIPTLIQRFSTRLYTLILFLLSSVLAPVAIAIILECRSEEHTSELQSRENLVCRLLLEKKKQK